MIAKGLMMAVTMRSEHTRFNMKTIPWRGLALGPRDASRMVARRSRLPAVPTTAATPSTVTYRTPSSGWFSSKVTGPWEPLLTNDAKSMVWGAPRRRLHPTKRLGSTTTLCRQPAQLYIKSQSVNCSISLAVLTYQRNIYGSKTCAAALSDPSPQENPVSSPAQAINELSEFSEK